MVSRIGGFFHLTLRVGLVVLACGAGSAWAAAPGFAPASTADIRAYPGTGPVAHGDFDGDGKQDVLFCYRVDNPFHAAYNPSASITAKWDVVWRPAQGTGGAAIRYTASRVSGGDHDGVQAWDSMDTLAAGDMDGDKDTDIVCGTLVDGIFWLENLGSGASWSAPHRIYYPGVAPDGFMHSYPNTRDLALGDFDADGDLDVAAVMGEYDNGGPPLKGWCSVFINQPGASPWYWILVDTGDAYLCSVALGNLTPGDGVGGGGLDIVIGGKSIKWAQYTGGKDQAMHFSAAVTITQSTVDAGVLAVTGDMNNDGRTDIVAHWPNAGGDAGFIVFPNSGSNNTSAFSYNTFKWFSSSTPYIPVDYTVQDVDLDGDGDLVALIPNASTVGSARADGFWVYVNPGGAGLDGSTTPSPQQYALAGTAGTVKQLTMAVFISEGAYDQFPDAFTGGADAEVTTSLTGNTYINAVNNVTVNAYKPTVTSITARTGRLLQVKFSLPMTDDVLSNLMYTVSGDGKGTLPDAVPATTPSHPAATVSRVDAQTVLLQWSSGAMTGNDLITVTVDTSVRGSGFNVPMSAGSGPYAATTTAADAPKVVSVAAQDSRHVLVTYNVHMNDSALLPANYTASGDGLGKLTANPDSVTKQTDTTYLLNWNANTMFNGAPLYVAVNAASTEWNPAVPDTLVRSFDNLPFVDPTSGNTTGIAVSPVIGISPPDHDVTSGGPVTFTVSYYKDKYPDEKITDITLTSNDILQVSDTSLPSKSAVEIGPGEIGQKAAAVTANTVSVTSDPAYPNLRTVEFSNIVGDGQFAFRIQSGTARDAAGNPVSSMTTLSPKVTVDNTPPVLTLTNGSSFMVRQHDTFNPLVDASGVPRVTAKDVIPAGGFSDLTSRIVANPPTVDTSQATPVGTPMTIYYGVSDAAGNPASSVSIQLTVNPAESFLVIQSSAGGTTSPSGGSFGFDAEHTATVTATPDRCHTFSGWNVTVDSGTPSFVAGNPWTGTMNAGVTTTVQPVFVQGACTPGVEIVWPNGGEKWPIGKTVQVLWRNYAASTGSTSDLVLMDTQYSILTKIAGAVSNDTTGEYVQHDWTVPATILPNDQYKMRVQWVGNTSIRADSAKTMTILAQDDDVSNYAQSIQTTGVKVADQFDYSGDADWFYFFAQTGFTYTIKTTDLGVNCDTYLSLFKSDAITLAGPDTFNDNVADHDWSSQIVWTATEDHNFFIQVKFSPDTTLDRDFGPATNFNVQVVQAVKQGVRAYPAALLHGRVLDAATGEPIYRAAISLPEIGDLTVFTNREGDYTIPGLTPGLHELTIAADGYDSKTEYVHLVHGDHERADFVLVPIPVAEGEGEGEVLAENWLSVTTSAGEGGMVVPHGSSVVAEDDMFHVFVMPDECHEIADVKVDGVSVGAVPQYIFHSVSGHHVLEAEFSLVAGREPQTPFNVTASQGMYHAGVRIAWQGGNAGSELYHVYRSATSDFAESAEVGGWVSETWVDDLNMQPAGGKQTTPDVSYYYRVVARNLCGESAPSEAVLGYPKGNQRPDAPTGVAASDGEFADHIRITWTAVEDAVDYQVRGSMSSDFSNSYTVGTWTTDTWVEDFHLAAGPGGGSGCQNSNVRDGEERFYQVVARNENGESVPSATEQGSVGNGKKAVYEPALPAKMTDGGLRAVTADAPVAVRLRADAPIDPDSVWGRVVCAAFDTDAVLFQPVDTSDGWVVYEPQTPWTVGDVIEMSAGGCTVDGETLAPVSYVFQVTESDLKAIQAVAASPVLPADVADGNASAVLYEEDGASDLYGAVGDAWTVGPEEAFDTPRRVWLPLPQGVGVEDLALHYLVAGEEWHPAAEVAGWLVPGSEQVYEQDGARWLGLLVRHGGTVQFAAPSASSGASVVPTSGRFTQLGTLLVYGAAVLVLASRKRRGRRA